MIGQKKHLKIIIVTITFISYFCMNSYIFFGVLGMNHHMNHSKMSGCTYVLGQDIVCSLNIFDYINKWKEISNIIIPFYNVLLLALFIPFYFSIFFISPLVFRLLIYLKKKIKIQSLYEMLYADGLLNSKAY